MSGYAAPSSWQAGAPSEERAGHAYLEALVAADRDIHRWRNGLLVDVTKIVIEAALDAELVVHLGRSRGAAGAEAGGNARNGSRQKTVRTAFGRVTLDAPRDRWGTFDPLTVGKWQRRVNGIDQLVVPLAALGADPAEGDVMLARLYGPPAGSALPGLITTEIGRRLAPWHQRRLDLDCRALMLDRVVVRSRDGQASTPPVQTVVGLTEDGDCVLLALRAGADPQPLQSWYSLLADLCRRGVDEVSAVLCDPCNDVRDAVVAVWPDAVVCPRIEASGVPLSRTGTDHRRFDGHGDDVDATVCA